ncbi:MAG TPA: type II CAAX endopeptidase family protein [Ktedonobacteraceae bacterium]|nr:type II CAAX endopeptidase family protein [Ktedonobacteraceae bacterium]
MIERSEERVPWTLQQTLFGTVLTLVPWVAFVLGVDVLNAKAPPINTVLTPQQDVIDAIIQFFFSSLIEAAFLIAPIYIALYAYRFVKPRLLPALRTLGFRKFPVGRSLLWVVVLMLVILGVNILYQYLITALRLNLQTNDQILLQNSKYMPIATYATLVVASTVAPLCEEVFFRGLIFTGFQQAMPLPLAILFSAILFGMAHLDPASFPILFVIGLALAFLRWRTNSLWPCILLHLVNNTFGAVLIIFAMNGITK